MMLIVACLCVLLLAGAEAVKPRRTDITDKGYSHLFHDWVDVQGQGVNNDYCRVVGPTSGHPYQWLSCALAGTQGQSQYNYNPPESCMKVFDVGYKRSWFMTDINGDKRDDYCRCVGDVPRTFISCMLAGRSGFGEQFEYRISGSKGCE